MDGVGREQAEAMEGRKENERLTPVFFGILGLYPRQLDTRRRVLMATGTTPRRAVWELVSCCPQSHLYAM